MILYIDQEAFGMGVLVKSAQAVEHRVESIRREFEPKARLKLNEARAQWLELKSRRNGCALSVVTLHVKASLLRADARLRIAIAREIGRIVVELEKARRTLTRGA